MDPRITRAVACAVIVLAMTLGRSLGLPWRGMVMPNQMRVLEGYDVQWESETMFRSTRAMVSNLSVKALYETGTFNTDDYRAILPMFTAAVATNLSGSWYWGSVASDALWWWAGAVATGSLLDRLGARRGAGTLASIFVGASPLGSAYVGSGNLHVASSLSLPIYLLLAFRFLDRRDLGIAVRALAVGVIGLLSSVTYNYQWVVFPVAGALALTPTRRHWAAPVAGGVAAFAAATWATRAVLDAVGLGVKSHINDPLAVLAGAGPSIAGGSGDPYRAALDLASLVTQVAGDTAWAFHPAVVAMAIAGTITSPPAVRLVTIVTSAVAFAQGMVYDVPWVTMSAFPMVYGAAACGLLHAGAWSVRMATRLGLATGWSRTIMTAALAAAVVAIAGLTNLDLAGHDGFAVRWWGFWYVPH